jgi:hypothetical protein
MGPVPAADAPMARRLHGVTERVGRVERGAMTRRDGTCRAQEAVGRRFA